MLLYLISIIYIIQQHIIDTIITNLDWLQKNPDFLDDRLNLYFFIVSVQIMFLSHQTWKYSMWINSFLCCVLL